MEGTYCLTFKLVKVQKDHIVQAQIRHAMKTKIKNKMKHDRNYSPSDTPQKGDSPLKLQTFEWTGSHNRFNKQGSFKIDAQPIESINARPTIVKTFSKILSPQSSINKQLAERGADLSEMLLKGKQATQIDPNIREQIDLFNKEKELLNEIGRKIKNKMESYKGDEKRFSKNYLILMKKACMIFGYYNAEQFFLKELKIKMSIFFKRHDSQHKYSKLV